MRTLATAEDSSLRAGLARRVRGRPVAGRRLRLGEHDGQLDEEARALARRALHADATAERGGQLAADRQAQARALAAALGRVEGLEDARQILGRDAVAVVADDEALAVALALRRDADLAAVGVRGDD